MDSPWHIVERRADAVIVCGDGVVGEPRCAAGMDWRALLCEALGTLHGAAMVGAKRVTADPARPLLFSMGEFVVHPKGFHHQGQGIDARAYRFPEEVDVIAGGVMAVRSAAFEAAGGLERLRGSLGAVEMGLAIRASGGRCFAVPQVVVADETTPQPTAEDAAAFRERWGFAWNAADLEAVRARHAGTGLLWHPRFHLAALPFEKYEDRPAMHWKSYAEVESYRQRADHLANIVKALDPRGPVIDLGCGDGLFAHLFAANLGVNAPVLGIDPETSAIAQAQQAIAGKNYTGDPPRFAVGSGDRLELPDASVAVIVMLDVIEHLPNPVRVLGEAARVLAPGGALLLSTPEWQYGGWSDAVYHVTEFTLTELVRLIEAATTLKVRDRARITGVYRDLVVVARKA